MKKIIAVALLILGTSGCASSGGKNSSSSNTLPSSYALPGTSVAIVGIGVNRKGIPLETVKEVVLLPGQRAIFLGPDKFEIVFKGKKSPTSKLKYESQDGIISILVPKDIFSRPDFNRESNKNNFIRFDYSIFVNGRELDPPFIVKREN
jgi:hypothetical protein